MTSSFYRNTLLTLSICCLVTFSGPYCSAQQGTKTFAERLGWKAGDRVLLIHVDDAGMSHDSDVGVERALAAGLATSLSVMMPCPWTPEIVHYLHQHPGLDAGLHLTLTSEWSEYRWGPVAGAQAVPGLVDQEGAMWPSVEEVVQHATADEVEKEIRAQLARARTMGFNPTHLDSHMGTVFANPAFLERYIKVGAENHIPIMFPGGHDTLLSEQYRDETIAALKNEGKWTPGQAVPEEPALAQARLMAEKVWDLGLPVLDDLYNVSYDWTLAPGVPETDDNLRAMKVSRYAAAFHSLKPGVTMMIVHCTDTSSTFPFISSSGPTRRGDLLAMLSPELRKAAQREGLYLTTWRELQERRDRVARSDGATGKTRQ
ncbi:MAG: polysaccharide deacetylase family protein [Terracidiphilus sp.]